MRELALGFKLIDLHRERLVLFALLLVFEVHFVFLLPEAGVVLLEVLAVAVQVLQFLDLLALLLHFFLEFVKLPLDVLVPEQRFFDGGVGDLVLLIGAGELSLALVELIDHRHVGLEPEFVLLDGFALLEQAVVALLPIRNLPL